jgi:diguanylate cyclase (GGDEF)-like protein
MQHGTRIYQSHSLHPNEQAEQTAWRLRRRITSQYRHNLIMNWFSAIVGTLNPQAVMVAGGFMAVVFGCLLLAQCLQSKTDQLALSLLTISTFCAAGGLFISATILNRTIDINQITAAILGITAYLCGMFCLIVLYRPKTPKRLMVACGLFCYLGFLLWPIGIATHNWSALCQFALTCMALAVILSTKDESAPYFRLAWLGLCLFSIAGLMPRVTEVLSILFDSGTGVSNHEVARIMDTAAYRIRALTWTISVAVSFGLTTGLINARNSKRLQNSVDIDLLTGAHSRQFLVEKANQVFNEKRGRLVQPHSLSTALLLIDIDHFKLVNDTWGHEVGDRVLEHCVHSIREIVRQSDAVVSRYGGEEFCVFLPQSNAKQATELAERIRVQIESKPYSHGNEKIALTVSIGAVHDSESSTIKGLKELINIADERLYKAKHLGRNRVIEQIDMLVI